MIRSVSLESNMITYTIFKDALNKNSRRYPVTVEVIQSVKNWNYGEEYYLAGNGCSKAEFISALESYLGLTGEFLRIYSLREGVIFLEKTAKSTQEGWSQKEAFKYHIKSFDILPENIQSIEDLPIENRTFWVDYKLTSKEEFLSAAKERISTARINKVVSRD